MNSLSERVRGIETPAVLIELEKLERNLRSMQRLADTNGVALRPHAKTHKSIKIASRQLSLGACGLTVATLDEAILFARHGKANSITISRPIVSSQKLDRLFAELAGLDVDLRLVVDSDAGIETASKAAKAAHAEVGTFIKIDVGLHRCGVDPHSARALELARWIVAAPALDFRGLLSHAGQAYAATSQAEVTQIAETERHIMLGQRDQLVEAGIEAVEISVGSTPTVLAAASFEGARAGKVYRKGPWGMGYYKKYRGDTKKDT